MTYDVGEGEEELVVPKLRMRMEDDGNGDYVKLKEFEDCEANELPCDEGKGRSFWWWIKGIVVLVCLAGSCVVFFKWVGPYIMEKIVFPSIKWETTTFSTSELAVIIFASVALFPTLLIPSSPSMWVAGMTFGYGYGFLLIMTAVLVGISLPYFIGSLFYRKIQGWLDKYPKKAAVIRLAGEGDWFNQCRAVALIRVSPFPYIVYNYCAVATNVKYGPYMLGSIIGIIPEIFAALYTGILIRTLADASHERQMLSIPQIILNVFCFCATAATAIIFTAYAKQQLLVQKREDQQPLLQ